MWDGCDSLHSTYAQASSIVVISASGPVPLTVMSYVLCSKYELPCSILPYVVEPHDGYTPSDYSGLLNFLSRHYHSSPSFLHLLHFSSPMLFSSHYFLVIVMAVIITYS